MACKRCEADPHPEDFGSPRRCAVDANGGFRPDNWNCATLDALLVDDRTAETVWGHDESMQIVCGNDYGGFLVVTRYKSRGRTSSAVHVGDFWPPKPFTLETAERWLDGTYWDEEHD